MPMMGLWPDFLIATPKSLVGCHTFGSIAGFAMFTSSG